MNVFKYVINFLIYPSLSWIFLSVFSFFKKCFFGHKFKIDLFKNKIN